MTDADILVALEEAGGEVVRARAVATAKAYGRGAVVIDPNVPFANSSYVDLARLRTIGPAATKLVEAVETYDLDSDFVAALWNKVTGEIVYVVSKGPEAS